MKTKDFSMVLEKVVTTTTKKDIGFVDGANFFVSQIENVLKTNKGENVSDIYFGSDLATYAYDINVNKKLICLNLESAIKYGIKKIFNVKVNLLYSSETLLRFRVDFSYSTQPGKSNPSSCIIEIPLT